MRFAKFVDGSNIRFCRVKRRGTKNCRVIWQDTNEEQLMPMAAVTECSAVEAGVTVSVSGGGSTAGSTLPTGEYPTQISGEELCRLMKEYNVSVKDLANSLGLPTERIREARSNGIDDPLSTLKWITMIQGR
ncbi:MAG: hypothetical protein ACKVP0_14645 [Pirellulaceae bacterium]